MHLEDKSETHHEGEEATNGTKYEWEDPESEESRFEAERLQADVLPNGTKYEWEGPESEESRFEAERWYVDVLPNGSEDKEKGPTGEENQLETDSRFVEGTTIKEQHSTITSTASNEAESAMAENDIQHGTQSSGANTVVTVPENKGATKGKKKTKIVIAIVSVFLVMAIAGGLIYYFTADSFKMSRVCDYVQNGDYESAAFILNQMKPSAEVAATKGLIEYLKTYHEAKDALKKLNVSNHAVGLAEIDILTDLHQTYIQGGTAENLPQQLNSVYKQVQQDYRQVFENVNTQSIREYFNLESEYLAFVKALKVFHNGFFSEDADQKTNYDALKDKMDDFIQSYYAFDGSDGLPESILSDYETIARKAKLEQSKNRSYDFDTLEEKLTDAQECIIYQYQSSAIKDYLISINRLQKMVDTSKNACDILDKELSDVFNSDSVFPPYINQFVTDCKNDCDLTQSEVDEYKKTSDSYDDLFGFTGQDPNFTTTDFFVGFYNTKSHENAQKNAAIAVNIVKAYLLAGDEINT